MPVAIGFFGFARDLDFDIRPYLDLYVGQTQFDIFIVIPDRFTEFGEELVQADALHAKFQDPRIRSLTVQLFSYSAEPWMKRARELGLPDYMQHCQYYPYRVISLINSITQAAKAMCEATPDISCYTLTRLDLINHTQAIGRLDPDENTVFGWRSCPFPQEGIAEDRLIVCGRRPLESLANYIHDFPSLPEERFGSEYILGAYLSAKHNMEMQQGTALTVPPRCWQKYSDQFRAQVNLIIGGDNNS